MQIPENMDKPAKRTFLTTAQVIWMVENNATPATTVVTTETLTVEREVAPDKGFFLYTLNAAIKAGRDTPTPTERHEATPMRIYGEVAWRQLTGPLLAEDGKTPTQADTE